MMNEDFLKLSEYEKTLIPNLRSEVQLVKECFTSFSFRAMAFAAAVLGLIAGFQRNEPFVGLASTLVILVLVSVARIGTHKYATANRLCGYELHLHRSRLFDKNGSVGWKPEMRAIGWEEAMRAWRVVQASIYEEIYYNKGWWQNKKRDEHKNRRIESPAWYEPEQVAKSVKGVYHAGSYLRVMLNVLHLAAFVSFLPLGIMCVQLYLSNWFWIPLAVLVLIVLLFSYVVHRTFLLYWRLDQLEEGLLSIHSCSIVWMLVSVAHFRAKSIGSTVEDIEYIQSLAEEANKLIEPKYFYNLGKWMKRPIPSENLLAIESQSKISRVCD